MEKGQKTEKGKVKSIQKTDEVGSPLLPQTKEIIEKKLSQDRIDALTTNLYKSINDTSQLIRDDLGDFTIYEIMDALLRVSHSYNKRFLDTQNKPQADESKG